MMNSVNPAGKPNILNQEIVQDDRSNSSISEGETLSRINISNRDNLSISNDFNCSKARKIGEHLSKIGYSLKDISKDEFEQIIVALPKELVLSLLNGESLTQEIIHSLADELFKESKDFEKRWCI